MLHVNWYCVKDNSLQILVFILLCIIASIYAWSAECYILFVIYLLVAISKSIMLLYALYYCNKHSRKIKK
jgi:hypothetical protein